MGCESQTCACSELTGDGELSHAPVNLSPLSFDAQAQMQWFCPTGSASPRENMETTPGADWTCCIYQLNLDTAAPGVYSFLGDLPELPGTFFKCLLPCLQNRKESTLLPRWVAGLCSSLLPGHLRCPGRNSQGKKYFVFLQPATVQDSFPLGVPAWGLSAWRESGCGIV